MHWMDANAFWGRESLVDSLKEALRSLGKDLGALSVDDLAPIDQFHGGGIASSRRLSALAGDESLRGARVVDIGGGLGGPARLLASEFGCSVVSVDITVSYIEAGAWLTRLCGLSADVCHVVGDALALPIKDESADVVWMQNASMNIADKRALYTEIRRVLRPGGLFIFQEPMAGPGPVPGLAQTSDPALAVPDGTDGLIYPVMWADNPSESFLVPPERAQAVLCELGFELRAWDDCSEEIGGTTSGKAPASGDVSIQRIVKGSAGLDAIVAAGRRNRAERKIAMVQAVLVRR